MVNYSAFKKIFATSILLILLFNSCIKDSIQELGNISGIEVDPSLSVPILDAHIGIKDIYNNFTDNYYIIQDSVKFITFIYKSDDNNLVPTQFVTIPSVNYNFDINMNQAAIAEFNALGYYSNSLSSYVVLSNPNKERLKKISVKTGNITFNLSSDFKHNVRLVYTYPSITKNGVPLVDTVYLYYSGISPTINNTVIDIAGYDIDLSDKGISYNVIPYLVDMNVTRISADPILTNDKLNVSINTNIQEYNFLQGYLGKFFVLNFTTSEKITIFDNYSDGNLFIKDPKVKIVIDNGIGMPITAIISNMVATTGKGNIFPVNIDQFKDTFTLAYPSINLMGQTIHSEYLIDRTNSNIDSVFSHAPQGIKFNVNFTANYNEDVESDNFLLFNNSLKAYAQVEFPLEVKLLNYQIRSKDTLIWPSSQDNISPELIKITGWYQNTFPLGSSIQLYFLKDSVILGIDSFAVIDSLYPQPFFMPGAIVDANGKILQPSVTTNEIIFSYSKYNRLKNISHKTLFVANIKTSEYNNSFPYVKFYSDQGLDFKIGVVVKGKYRLPLKK